MLTKKEKEKEKTKLDNKTDVKQTKFLNFFFS